MNAQAPADRDALADAIRASGVELVRFAWCDAHGLLRGKTLTATAALAALTSGVGMVSTLMLKDTSDRTAFKVFEPGIGEELPGFGYANNLLLHPIPRTWRVLPWAASTGWVQCQPHFDDGRPVPYDTRTQLQRALGAGGPGARSGLRPGGGVSHLPLARPRRGPGPQPRAFGLAPARAGGATHPPGLYAALRSLV